MRRVLMAVILLALFAAESQACQRCGLFGLRCRYYKAPVVAYAPAAAVVKQADVFVVQNNYPQPIGAYAAQGQTVYGLQQASLAYQVNHAEVLRQSAELARAASATAQIGLTGYNQTAGTALAISASISEPLARGHAASQVLAAAGLSQPSAQQQSLALKITRGSDGQWQVLQADAAEVNAQVSASINEHSVPVAPQPVNGNSVLAAKCARCHGLNLTEPRGGVFLDAGHQINCDLGWAVMDAVDTGRMPKGGPPLTDQEKGLLYRELKGLVLKPSP